VHHGVGDDTDLIETQALEIGDFALVAQPGVDGCPFNCPSFFPEPIQYDMGMCPRTEDLLARGVSVSIGPMYEEDDLDDIITGVHKVAHHLL